MFSLTTPLPYYSPYHAKKRIAAAAKAREAAAASSPTTSAPSTASNPELAPSAPGSVTALTDLLEPAVDGPPSPERIRALNKQMQRAASISDKHHGQTHSSASSSLHSLSSDRPSWDPSSLEHITLTRRSSGRSTASSMPSRDLQDSVQLFGKSIFSRKTKLKREDTSAHSSSAGSTHSPGHSLDASTPFPPLTQSASLSAANSNAPSITKLPGLFGRRKTAKQAAAQQQQQQQQQQAEDASASRKFSISGPYNFQHVTHTQRDHLQNLQRASRMELVDEFSTLHPAPTSAPTPGSGGLRGIRADDLHFSDFASEGVYIQQEEAREAAREAPQGRQAFMMRQTGSRRLIKPVRSQEQLRISPPRPPRSPIDPITQAFVTNTAPPVPPPRLSSRQSIRYDGYDPLDTTTLQRPRTSSGGFRHPEPFRLAMESNSSRPGSPHSGVSYSSAQTFSPPTSPHSRPTSEDAGWPLVSPASATTFETLLPDVPEEEETVALSRRSRISVVSNSSSLRRSQSVPLLHLLQPPNTSHIPRPPSAGSDTLGAAYLGVVPSNVDGNGQYATGIALSRSSWEEDIDYCYEHEAEADCDYEWTRPSLDESRDNDIAISPRKSGSANTMSTRTARPDSELSSNLLSASPSQFEIPALSPASQTSNAELEAPTPTGPARPPTANFSLPRPDSTFRPRPPRPAQLRPISHASSFKESHGFHLSPSLLIPCDYQEQFMLVETEFDGYRDVDRLVLDSFDHNAAMKPDQPAAMDRTSTSTTDTGASSQSNTSTERHTSANSTSTAYTRFTGSSASVEDLHAWGLRRSGHGSLGSESIPVQSPTSGAHDKEAAKYLSLEITAKHALAGRPRARTTSLSTPPPPTGRYSLFPPAIQPGNNNNSQV